MPVSCSGTAARRPARLRSCILHGKQFELKRPRRSCTPRRLPSAFSRGSTETCQHFPLMNVDIAAWLQVWFANQSKQRRHILPIVSEVLNVSRHSPGHLPAISNQAASTPLCLTACCQQLFPDRLLTHMLFTLAPSVVSALR